MKTLSYTWKRVLDCIVMGLSPEKTIEYLEKEDGIVIALRTYFYIKKKLKDDSLISCFEIAKNFPERHMERVNTVRHIQEESWKNYQKALSQNNIGLAQKILDSIRDLQPFISAYEEASKDIIEHGKDNNTISKAKPEEQRISRTGSDERIPTKTVG